MRHVWVIEHKVSGARMRHVWVIEHKVSGAWQTHDLHQNKSDARKWEKFYKKHHPSYEFRIVKYVPLDKQMKL
jgi:hypothetical protein